MKKPVNLKDKIVLCYDYGLFFDICFKLTDFYKKVYYFSPFKDAFPAITKSLIGTEWRHGKRLNTFDDKQFESVDDFFDYVEEADIIFFPDVSDGDLQEYLESKGKLVFGSRKGEELELERWDTKQYFKKIGMDVQPIKRIVGVDALKEHLKKVENKWIKISKFRKHFETFYHADYKLTEPMIQKIEWELGPIAKIVEFIVEDNIEAIVEDGYDGYCIDGKFPNYTFSGTEVKEKSFAGRFSKYEDLSDGVKKVNKQMSPILKEYGVRGFMSSEVRITKDGKYYNIDPCMRCPSPPNEIYQEIYKNLGEIIWEGANGNCIDPIPAAKYGIEVLIHSDWFNNEHQAIYFPPEIRQWVKLRNPIKIDGEYYTLNTGHSVSIGALVGIGNTLEECKAKIVKMTPMIEGYGISISLPDVDEAIETFKKSLKT